MRFGLALPLLLLVPTVSVAADSPKTVEAGQAEAQAVAERVGDSASPAMAAYERLTRGEWKVTMASGETSYHAWQWGPGKYSLRKMTEASDAESNAWAGEVIFWHPGRQQVCVLSLHGEVPGVGRGSGVGTMTFDGQTAEAFVDLYQPRGPRKLSSQWVFDGPDRYRDVLLEDAGDGFQPMNQWEFVRVPERRASASRPAGVSAELPERLKPFSPLLGPAWEARAESIADKTLDIRARYRWAPDAEAVFVRVTTQEKDGRVTDAFDAYFYHDVRTDAVRCLALSSRGGVYEGDVAMLGSGGMEAELKGYEGDRLAPHVLRIDIGKDGTVHHRVWSGAGEKRTLLLDSQQTKHDPK